MTEIPGIEPSVLPSGPLRRRPAAAQALPRGKYLGPGLVL